MSFGLYTKVYTETLTQKREEREGFTFCQAEANTFIVFAFGMFCRGGTCFQVSSGLKCWGWTRTSCSCIVRCSAQEFRLSFSLSLQALTESWLALRLRRSYYVMPAVEHGGSL